MGEDDFLEAQYEDDNGGDFEPTDFDDLLDNFEDDLDSILAGLSDADLGA